VTGAIFALKNFGWKDKQEIDHGVTDQLAALMGEIGSEPDVLVSSE